MGGGGGTIVELILVCKISLKMGGHQHPVPPLLPTPLNIIDSIQSMIILK